MIGFLHNLFERWAVRRQAKEMQQFVGWLSTMNSEEIATVLACATHIRHQLREKRGWMLLQPASEIGRDPAISLKVSQAIKQLQTENRPTDAVALMVWLHSLRAMYRAGLLADLQNLGRAMWRELVRGADQVERVAAEMTALVGTTLNIDGYREIPEGLAPELPQASYA